MKLIDYYCARSIPPGIYELKEVIVDLYVDSLYTWTSKPNSVLVFASHPMHFHLKSGGSVTSWHIEESDLIELVRKIDSSNSSWWAYMLECNDGTLYTGATNNFYKRLEVHNKGNGAKYTRTRLPVRLVWLQEFSSKSEAHRVEAAVKKMPRDQKKLIAGL